MTGERRGQSALEWIRRQGRFQRTVSAGALRKALGRRRGECTWCGRPILNPRRRTWCGPVCTEEFLSRTFRRAARIARERDRGVCQICRLDSIRIVALLRRLQDVADRQAADPERAAWRETRRLFLEHLRSRGLLTRRDEGREVGRLMEVDHIVPVSEGGGCCPASGLRLLCRVCHRQVSRDLAGRRARRGKKALGCHDMTLKRWRNS